MSLDIYSQLQAGFINIKLGAVQRGSDALLSAGASQMPEDAGGFFQEKGKIFTAQTGKFLGMEMLRPHKGGGGLYQKIHHLRRIYEGGITGSYLSFSLTAVSLTSVLCQTGDGLPAEFAGFRIGCPQRAGYVHLTGNDVSRSSAPDCAERKYHLV